MGTLAHFNLAAIRARYGIKSFVETGTAQGDGVEVARQAGFEVIHSIEIVPEIAALAKRRFDGDPRVAIWTGESAYCLPMILRELPHEPCLFWLDAHFPGAHHGAAYDAESDVGRRLPLERELAIIRAARPESADVVFCDDARIYQPGPYGAGDLPADWPPLRGVTRSLQFARELYGRTHGVVVDYADQGYVMICPRLSYEQVNAA